jgi:hypothetical protein
MVAEGCLLLPLAYALSGVGLVALSLALIIGGYLISNYYQKCGIHVHRYTCIVGLPVLFLANVLACFLLSLPMIAVCYGAALFVLLIWSVHFARKAYKYFFEGED